jgi:hypothetical protein
MDPHDDSRMKSCLGILLAFFTIVVLLGGGVFIWYLSYSTEFSRAGTQAKPAQSTPAR